MNHKKELLWSLWVGFCGSGLWALGFRGLRVQGFGVSVFDVFIKRWMRIMTLRGPSSDFKTSLSLSLSLCLAFCGLHRFCVGPT